MTVPGTQIRSSCNALVDVRLRPDDDGERPVLSHHPHLEVVLGLQELVEVARAVDLKIDVSLLITYLSTLIHQSLYVHWWLYLNNCLIINMIGFLITKLIRVTIYSSW